MSRKTLIRGASIVSMDPRIGDIPTGDILIVDDSIAEIAPSISADDAEIVDAHGMIASPGFVDTHRHVWQTQLKGVAIDWSLLDYLCQMRTMYSVCYDAEDAYMGNYGGALDMINVGITSVVDHSHLQISAEHSEGLVKGLQDAGIRGVLCYGVYRNPKFTFDQAIDPAKVVRDVMGPLEDFHRSNALHIRDTYFPSNDGLLRFGIAASEFSAAANRENMLDEMAWTRSLEPWRVSIHAGGGINNVFRIVSILHEQGQLDERLLFVHGCNLTDHELSLIAESGGGVSTTPETELQMGMGFPVLERVEKSGGLPSLGIDIVSNFSGDMFAQMRIMLQTLRFRHFEEAKAGLPKTARYPARKVLEYATLGGAKAIGLGNEIGSLTPGKKADLLLTRLDSVGMAPVADPIAALVFYANANDIDSVWINGVARKRGGQLVGIDWAATRKRLVASRDNIVAKYARIPEAAIRRAWEPYVGLRAEAEIEVARGRAG